MAKCKDCSTDIGFLKKRCEPCDAKYKAAESERRAEAQRLAAEEAKVAGSKREAEAFEQAKANLTVTWDKFEQKGNISGHEFKPTYGPVKLKFSCVNKKTWWLVATQSQDDWDWLENNRTIILFDEDTRFIQEHGQLRATDVYTNWNDNVKCYEEHHVDITESIPSFLKFYEENKLDSPNATVMLRIGRLEFAIPLKEIRTIAAMAAKAAE